MKYLLLPCVMISFLVSCSDEPAGNTDLSPKSFDSLISANPHAQLVDVRTLEEYGSGHIAGAMNYDWNDAAFADNAKELDRSNPVLVYCRSGSRSGEAAEYLRKEGYTVYELDGGITAWENADMPVEKSDEGNITAASDVVTLEMYNKTVAENDVVLVDFAATWCGPCKLLAPSLHELETELSGKFVLLKIDVDRDVDVANEMNIMAMPTLILYKKGEIQWRNEGLVPKEMVAEKINSVQ